MSSYKHSLYILFRIIPIILHILGVYLLLNVKYIKRYHKVQGIYLMWLSIVEITMNMSKIVIKVTETSNPNLSLRLDIVRTGFLSTQMMLALSAMTIDRAVFVKLNMKYNLELASTTAKVAIFNSVLTSLLVMLAMFLTQTTKEQLSNTKRYYWTIYDAFVVIVFVVCYASMIHTIKKTSKKLFCIESDIYKNRMRKAIMVPTTIVLSFIIFWMSTNTIILGFHLVKEEKPEWLKIALNIMVSTAYSTDAVFYIYFCRPIRRAMKKKFSWKKKKKQDVCVINRARVTTESYVWNSPTM